LEVLSLHGHVSVRDFDFSGGKNINILKRILFVPRKEIVA